MSKAKWVTIDDTKVELHFRCENDRCDDPEEANVEPGAFVESGIPMCECCDEEMTYQRTRILVKDVQF